MSDVLHEERAESTPPPVPHHGHDASEATTRQRVLQLVAGEGPIAAAELAARLDLTPAAIRRHLGVLESGDQIAVHDGAELGPARRGRPGASLRRHRAGADRPVAPVRRDRRAGAALPADTAGAAAVEGFAGAARGRARARVWRPGSSGRPASDVADAVEALANALSVDGYAATARTVPGRHAVQLCQGHCPVQDVAHEFPQLCDAEARAFSRLLGVHVQRLATLAGGGHVCTTNIPVTGSSAADDSLVGPSHDAHRTPLCSHRKERTHERTHAGPGPADDAGRDDRLDRQLQLRLARHGHRRRRRRGVACRRTSSGRSPGSRTSRSGCSRRV